MISGLYARLLSDRPNPFIELNHAISLYYSGKKPAAFEVLNGLLKHPFLSRYYLLNATLGKFYRIEGHQELAKHFLSKALKQAAFDREKELIRNMIHAL
jgi:RNA polymerase sigma-70 factor (ECF subfamily)